LFFRFVPSSFSSSSVSLILCCVKLSFHRTARCNHVLPHQQQLMQHTRVWCVLYTCLHLLKELPAYAGIYGNLDAPVHVYFPPPP
jgi:hypothetical protein